MPGWAEGPLDLRRAAALSALVGWNQTEADWRHFVEHGEVRALDDGGPALVATAATLRFSARLGWISMVLVRPDRRGQGLATRLMQWAIERLRAQGTACIALDATPAGRPVYAKLGFVAQGGFARWRLPGPMPTASGLRPMRADDLDAAARRDEAAFGAPRVALLASLRQRLPHAAFLAPDGGFVFARDGLRHPQIGPLVAPDAATARALVGAASGALAQPFLLDLRDDVADLALACEAAGGVRERPFTRMSLGAPIPGDAALCPVLAGPEFG
jgi:GNAT superfamily N-acetyltransferase